MTVVSFADEYRKRVGLRIRYLVLDGRPMTVAEFNRIPVDDTSDDEGVVVGWVNLCRVLRISVQMTPTLTAQGKWTV